MFRDFRNPLYQQWRKKVYKRDNFVCQWPGCTNSKKLNAHHIKKWSDYPGLRFEEKNGITLCNHHHKAIKNMEEIYEGVLLKLVANKYG